MSVCHGMQTQMGGTVVAVLSPWNMLLCSTWYAHQCIPAIYTAPGRFQTLVGSSCPRPFNGKQPVLAPPYMEAAPKADHQGSRAESHLQLASTLHNAASDHLPNPTCHGLKPCSPDCPRPQRMHSTHSNHPTTSEPWAGQQVTQRPQVRALVQDMAHRDRSATNFSGAGTGCCPAVIGCFWLHGCRGVQHAVAAQPPPCAHCDCTLHLQGCGKDQGQEGGLCY